MADVIHSIVALAKTAIREYILNNKVIEPSITLTPELSKRAGVFVSLKKAGRLRGCIGTYMPTTRNLAEEIIQNAISAATRDPRFSPVKISELEEIEYSVDVLSPPESVRGIESLDPKRYGIIVRSGVQRGLLLPNLEGVNTIDMQIEIAKEKAGIQPDEDVELFRFEVERHKE